MKRCWSLQWVKGCRERSVGIELLVLVHLLRPVFVVPQHFAPDALRELPRIRLHMVAHEQRMEELLIGVVASMKGAGDIGDVGDGQIQAEDARVVHPFIDTETTVTAWVFVERHRQLQTWNAGEQKGRPAILVCGHARLVDVRPKGLGPLFQKAIVMKLKVEATLT